MAGNVEQLVRLGEFSRSELRGTDLLSDLDQRVYSPGISTGGAAEIRMALSSPGREIVATTIDDSGLRTVRERLEVFNLQRRVQIKLEDVSKPLPYDGEYFDYIYARLVLHYLSRSALDSSLAELFRVLRGGGRLYAVVRSQEDPDTKIPGASFDPETCFTAYPFMNEQGQIESGLIIRRYFHSQESIGGHLSSAGFAVQSIEQYDERNYLDFNRTRLSSQTANIIAATAAKPD